MDGRVRVHRLVPTTNTGVHRSLANGSAFAHPVVITLDSLVGMAGRPEPVFNRILELSAARCGWLVRVGQVDEALELLSWADTLGPPPVARRARARAKADIMRAIAYQRKGAMRRCATAVGRATLVDPIFVFETFVRGAVMLVRGRLTRLRTPVG